MRGRASARIVPGRNESRRVRPSGDRATSLGTGSSAARSAIHASARFCRSSTPSLSVEPASFNTNAPRGVSRWKFRSRSLGSSETVETSRSKSCRASRRASSTERLDGVLASATIVSAHAMAEGEPSSRPSSKRSSSGALIFSPPRWKRLRFIRPGSPGMSPIPPRSAAGSRPSSAGTEAFRWRFSTGRAARRSPSTSSARWRTTSSSTTPTPTGAIRRRPRPTRRSPRRASRSRSS